MNRSYASKSCALADEASRHGRRSACKFGSEVKLLGSRMFSATGKLHDANHEGCSADLTAAVAAPLQALYAQLLQSRAEHVRAALTRRGSGKACFVREASALGLPEYRVYPDHLARVFTEAVFASQAGAQERLCMPQQKRVALRIVASQEPHTCSLPLPCVHLSAQRGKSNGTQTLQHITSLRAKAPA